MLQEIADKMLHSEHFATLFQRKYLATQALSRKGKERLYEDYSILNIACHFISSGKYYLWAYTGNHSNEVSKLFLGRKQVRGGLQTEREVGLLKKFG